MKTMIFFLILLTKAPKISPFLPKNLCDPETHNRIKFCGRLKNGVNTAIKAIFFSKFVLLLQLK